MESIIRILTTLGLAAGLVTLFSAMGIILFALFSVIEAVRERSIKTLFTTWNDAQDYLIVSNWRIMVVSVCIAIALWMVVCAIS